MNIELSRKLLSKKVTNLDFFRLAEKADKLDIGRNHELLLIVTNVY